jgi:hypothetical protein
MLDGTPMTPPFTLAEGGCVVLDARGGHVLIGLAATVEELDQIVRILNAHVPACTDTQREAIA